MKAKIILVIALFLVLPPIVWADTLGQTREFFVEPIYDEFTRNSTTATLRKISSRAYFYFDNQYWNELDSNSQARTLAVVDALALEFEDRIYPTLTSNFGSEYSPGIDKDSRITILIHPMGQDIGGYFDSGDEYSKVQVSTSNEREMVYLNANYITQELTKSYLAHEFTHLISFNQKDVTYGISEETWLNESRAEYVSTILGYDEEFTGTNIEIRVKEFLLDPSDSLTEWKNKQADYGVINMFVHYLVDHYGVETLTDSLKSSKIGIESINSALKQNGLDENFSQVFTNWAIAALVNDCDLNEKYCYKNPDLKRFIITPFMNFLPVVGESSLSMTDYIKEWSGNWYKIIGGKGVLKLEFSGEKTKNFKVPYVITQKSGKREIGFLKLDEENKATLYIPDFNTENDSLTIIPLIQSKLVGFGALEPVYQFSFKVSTVEKTPEQEEKQIQELLGQIAYLQKEIATVQAKIQAILAKKQSSGSISCQKLNRNLYYGLTNDPQVKCLQEFLKSQGVSIYPEGMVTGFFGPLTKNAVGRFQEKYANEILYPLGLFSATGWVGERTRAKINELIYIDTP